MCLFWSKKKKDNIEAQSLLRRYVSVAEPTINKQLREGTADEREVTLFDTLFTNACLPSALYRWLPSAAVQINDKIIVDNAYLSCSQRVDDFINHINDDNPACYIIKTYDGLKSIDVNRTLPDFNDEGEYVLPRGMKLQVLSDKVYQQPDYNKFLSDIHCDSISNKELIDNYQSIRLITTAPLLE
jgi:hypothetical protein